MAWLAVPFDNPSATVACDLSRLAPKFSRQNLGQATHVPAAMLLEAQRVWVLQFAPYSQTI